MAYNPSCSVDGEWDGGRGNAAVSGYSTITYEDVFTFSWLFSLTLTVGTDFVQRNSISITSQRLLHAQWIVKYYIAELGYICYPYLY